MPDASSADAATRNDLRPGDLLFQDIDGGPLCDAIRAVTRGWNGRSFVHVGIVSRAKPGDCALIEAYDEGVVETPLDVFMARCALWDDRPAAAVGRLVPALCPLIPAALAYARAQIGRPYNNAFTLNDRGAYCAQLVYEAFTAANGGVPVFETAPMTFNDPATGRPHPAWREHFASRGLPIPEGRPGVNAADISRSPVIRMRAWRHASAR
ncbi:MAG: hypothetical protein D6744_11195, partial [Planctomycetota bacterium]